MQFTFDKSEAQIFPQESDARVFYAKNNLFPKGYAILPIEGGFTLEIASRENGELGFIKHDANLVFKSVNDLFIPCADCGDLLLREDARQHHNGGYYCEYCEENHYSHGDAERADFLIKEAKEAA